MKPSGLFLALALGCGRGPELVEGDGVIQSIDRLRAAPAGEIEGRSRLVTELMSRPARLAAAKDARDACASGFRSMLDGLVLKERARASVERREKSTMELARDLAAAQAKLMEAETAMTACSRAEAELRRRLR